MPVWSIRRGICLTAVLVKMIDFENVNGICYLCTLCGKEKYKITAIYEHFTE